MINNEKRIYDLPGLENCSNIDYLWNVFQSKEQTSTIIRNITKNTKLKFPKGGFNAKKYEESEYIKATTLGKTDFIMAHLEVYFHYFDLKNYGDFLSPEEEEDFNLYLMSKYIRWRNEDNCYLLDGVSKVFYDNYINLENESTPNIKKEIAILKVCLDNYNIAKKSDAIKKYNAFEKQLESKFGAVYKKFDF